MPNIMEIRVAQRRTLHELLRIKKDLDEQGITSNPLNVYINATKTEMDAEDVAYVEKMFSELK